MKVHVCAKNRCENRCDGDDKFHLYTKKNALQWPKSFALILSLVGLALAACGSASHTPPSSAASAAGEPAVYPLAPTATTHATNTTTATPTPSPSPTVTVPSTPTPDLGVLLRSPLPTPGAIFVRSPTLGIVLSPPISSTLPISAATGHIFVQDAAFGAIVPFAGATASPAFEPTPDGTARTVRAPILMYHYVSDPPPDADVYRRDLSVSPTRFEEHLERMQAEGYTTISLYALLAYLTKGIPLPPKPVILTFDDGYRDAYENAFPRLQAHGMTATFFIITDFVDEQRPEYLSWEMVKTMFAAGMSIESHGRNHVSLRGKDNDYLVWQALGSLETIQYELGVRPRFISYPAGEYDRSTIAIFRSANYWGGITTIQGATHTSDDLFELRRVRIRGETTADDLMRLLALDW